MLLSDRIFGMMTGGALGDALGAPHEFRYNPKNYTGILEYRPHLMHRYTNTNYWGVVGQTTDDTEMSIILASHILDNEYDINLEKLTLSYMEWANDEGTKMMGMNTRSRLKGIKTYKGYLKRPSTDTQSNGPLMRCAPIIISKIMNPDNIKNLIRMDSNITNPSPVCYEVCKIYINLFKIIYSEMDILEYIENINSGNEDIMRAIDDGIKDRYRDVTKQKGWIMHALYFCVRSLFHTNNYKDAIDFIVLSYGDCDTNAAIVGSLLGFMYGYRKLSSDKVNRENIEILINSDYSEGDLKVKNKFTIGDFLDSYRKKIKSLDL